jgi:hypothetical protein
MDKDNLQSRYQQRNPYTYEKHRRETFWQIRFPLIVFLLLILLGAVIVILAPAEKTSIYADIAMIYIITLMMVVIILLCVLMIGSVYFARQILQKLPFYMFQAQEFMFKMRRRVMTVSNRSVEPILRVRSASEGVRAFGRSITGK